MTDSARVRPVESPSQAGDPPVDDLPKEDLAAATGRAILQTAGVAAIEPSLAQACHQMQRTAQRLLNSAAPAESVADGVRLSEHDGRVDVTVEIAVSGDRSALAVARSVRDNVSVTIADTGLHPGRIAVSVLRLDELDD